MHREAVTQQTKKEGHSGASVISGLFPGVQVERDWWGALQQVCSCRSRLAHKRRLTATERRGETPSGKFSPNNSSLFLVRSSWIRRKSQKHGFGSRSWVKMSSPHCGSANCWRPSTPQLISCRTSITFMSTELRQRKNSTRRFSWPFAPVPSCISKCSTDAMFIFQPGTVCLQKKMEGKKKCLLYFWEGEI